jgi:hypothetical protein
MCTYIRLSITVVHRAFQNNLLSQQLSQQKSAPLPHTAYMFLLFPEQAWTHFNFQSPCKYHANRVCLWDCLLAINFTSGELHAVTEFFFTKNKSAPNIHCELANEKFASGKNISLTKSTYNTSKVRQIYSKKGGNYVESEQDLCIILPVTCFSNKTELRNAPHTILAHFTFLRIYNMKMLLKIHLKRIASYHLRTKTVFIANKPLMNIPHYFERQSDSLNFVTYLTFTVPCKLRMYVAMHPVR